MISIIFILSIIHILSQVPSFLIPFTWSSKMFKINYLRLDDISPFLNLVSFYSHKKNGKIQMIQILLITSLCICNWIRVCGWRWRNTTTQDKDWPNWHWIDTSTNILFLKCQNAKIQSICRESINPCKKKFMSQWKNVSPTYWLNFGILVF